MFKGLGDMGDLSKMMEAAQQMQTKMTEMQEGLARLTVTGTGVVWPAPDDPFAKTVEAASRHRLVWVDVETDQAASD